MLKFETLLHLLVGKLTSHSVLALQRDGYVCIGEMSESGLIDAISNYNVSIDEDIVDALCLEGSLPSSRVMRIRAGSLLSYTSMFWHFNNGFTGVDEQVRRKFITFCEKNRIRFLRAGSNDVITPSEFVANTPDRVVLWLYTLVLSLALLDSLQELTVDLMGVDINTITSAAKLVSSIGLALDIFGWNFASFKGLSKSCGDWAIEENRRALFALGSQIERIGTTTKAVYDYSARLSLDKLTHNDRIELCAKSLTYYRQYMEIVMVILSFVFGAVIEYDDTPDEAIAAIMPIISTYGRIVHALYAKHKELIENYVGSN